MKNKYKLVMKYKDGSEAVASTTRKEHLKDIDRVLGKYLRQAMQSSLEECILYRYPLKNNHPVLILKDGTVIKEIHEIIDKDFIKE